MKEPEPLRQIHKIREKNYEVTKNMSHEEYIKYTHKKAARVKKLLAILKQKKSLKRLQRKAL